MTAAYFEEHPTDPDKVILRKPSLDQGADYERGFVDGMQKQMQSSVDKAVNAMSQRTWVGLTEEDRAEILSRKWWDFEDEFDVDGFLRLAEAKLKEKNT
jgi:hypothetical protein